MYAPVLQAKPSHFHKKEGVGERVGGRERKRRDKEKTPFPHRVLVVCCLLEATSAMHAVFRPDCTVRFLLNKHTKNITTSTYIQKTYKMDTEK